MKNGILEIDHLLTYVKSVDEASRVYERMGFSLTPISHITTMGIVNRLVLLQGRTAGAANFVELMGVADAGLLPPPMQTVLSGGAGIKSMVMATPDAAQAHRALSAAGYAFSPPHHVRREWVLPGEGSVWPEFDVLLPIPAPLSFNLCQYHNLALYQRPDWQQHRNSAVSLIGVLAVADDPAADIGYFQDLFGGPAKDTADGGTGVSPAAVDLVMYTREKFGARFGALPASVVQGQGPRYAGMRIGVASLASLVQCLRDGDIVFIEEAGRVVVDPASALGNVIEFVEQAP